MKVLTLKQPWATLVAEGLKKYEFRSWKTNYRGELLIHAGKGIDKEGMEMVRNMNFDFQSSKIIAKVLLIDCLELNEELNKEIIDSNNKVYKNKTDRTGYAWKLEVIQKIYKNEYIKGKLGLWDIPLK